MVLPILTTKIQAPKLRMNAMHRTRLLEGLESGLAAGRKLTLISAPAGYGKTTLTVDWMTGRSFGAAWISLDARDNEPIRFFSYMEAAIRQVYPGFGADLSSLFSGTQFPDASYLASILCNEFAEASEQIVCVFDDMHMVQEGYIFSVLQYLLEYMPSRLHLVMMTREDPFLPLARMRARNEITEIRQDDLRFSLEEAGQFLEQIAGVHLEGDSLRLLEQQTEGWAVGLQLAGLSLGSRDGEAAAEFIRGFQGSQRYVLDYLMEEVVLKLEEDIRSFLMKTSVLERFNAALCDLVTGRNDSVEVMERLERSNLFLIPLDDSRQWYRYHHLFADLLRVQVPAAVRKQVQEAAARWMDAGGFPVEAVEYALAAEAWELARDLIVRSVGFLFRNGEFRTLLGWLEAIPEEIVTGCSQVAVYKAWCLFLLGRAQEASAYTDLCSKFADEEGEPLATGCLYALQTLMRMSRADRDVYMLAEKAVRLIGHTDPFFRTMAEFCFAQACMAKGERDQANRLFYQVYHTGRDAGQHMLGISALVNLSINLIWRGKRGEAAALCRQAVSDYTDKNGKMLPLAGILYIPLGIAAYEGGELDRAEDYLQQGLEINRKLAVVHFIGEREKSMAMTLFAKGREAEAFTLARETGLLARRVNLLVVEQMMQALEAEFSLKSGRPEAAVKWAEEMGLTPENCFVKASADTVVFAYARLLLHQKRLVEAAGFLQKLILLLKDRQRVDRVITALLLLAQAENGQGGHKEAAVCMEQALELAAPEGYRQSFLYEGGEMLPFLRKAGHAAPRFAGELMESLSANLHEDTLLVLPVNPAQNSPCDELLEPLSERELEILNLVAAGMSNDAIAKKLYITLGTTKWHINRIYSKLGVERRTQAVETARRLRLIQ